MSLTLAEIEIVSSAIRAAGDELLGLWPGAKKASTETRITLGVEQKSDGSLVSKADYAANKVLTEKLEEAFPGYAIHSEEAFAATDSWNKAPVWIIDPLDGTTLFLNGGPEFAVLVSLVEDGRVIAGFMYFPVLAEMYFAIRDSGAFLNGERIQLTRPDVLKAKSIATRKVSIKNSELEFSSGLNTQVAFREMLNGRLQGAIFLTGNLGEWDLAGPSILVEEAGGEFTDWSGAQLTFRPGSLPLGFAVSLGVKHGEILEQIVSVAPTN